MSSFSRLLLFAAAVPAAVLSSLHAQPSLPPPLHLSEVMADPVRVEDRYGEYLELWNPGPAPIEVDSLRIRIGKSLLAMGRLRLAAGGFALLCRDTSSRNGGLPCTHSLPDLELANADSLRLVLLYREGGRAFEIPYALGRPRAGLSFDNTGEELRGYGAFAPASTPFNGEDRGSPGTRPVPSGAARNDWALLAVRPQDPGAAGLPGLAASGPKAWPLPDEAFDAVQSFEVRLSASPAAGPTFLLVEKDADWDGVGEERVDSLALPSPAPAGAEARMMTVTVRLKSPGLHLFRLGPDEDPRNDQGLVLHPALSPFRFSEICPSPEEGRPEWVEVKSALPFRTSLELLRFDGIALPEGATAGAFERFLLAEDAPALRGLFPGLGFPAFEPSPWPSLRNSGDTLRLHLEAPRSLPSARLLLDSLAYGSRLGSGKGCLERTAGGALIAKGEESPPSPGLGSEDALADRGPELRLLSRLADRKNGKPLRLEIRSPGPKAYELGLFDLAGNRVRHLARAGRGDAAFAWTGEDDRGRPLKPGPYILFFRAEGRKALRKTVVLADEL